MGCISLVFWFAKQFNWMRYFSFFPRELRNIYLSKLLFCYWRCLKSIVFFPNPSLWLAMLQAVRAGLSEPWCTFFCNLILVVMFCYYHEDHQRKDPDILGPRSRKCHTLGTCFRYMPKDSVVPTHSSWITSTATGAQCYRKKLFGLTFIPTGSHSDKNREVYNYLDLRSANELLLLSTQLLVETKHHQELLDCCFCALS